MKHVIKNLISFSDFHHRCTISASCNCYPKSQPLLPMLPLIPEHCTQSDSSSSAAMLNPAFLPGQHPIISGHNPVNMRSRPTSMLITTRTLPHPPRKRHSHHQHHRRSKTMIRSRSVPCSSYLSQSPTPASTPSPSVSTQEDEEIFEAEVKISPPRPVSLDLQTSFNQKQLSKSWDARAQSI